MFRQDVEGQRLFIATFGGLTFRWYAAINSHQNESSKHDKIRNNIKVTVILPGTTSDAQNFCSSGTYSTGSSHSFLEPYATQYKIHTNEHTTRYNASNNMMHEYGYERIMSMLTSHLSHAFIKLLPFWRKPQVYLFRHALTWKNACIMRNRCKSISRTSQTELPISRNSQNKIQKATMTKQHFREAIGNFLVVQVCHWIGHEILGEKELKIMQNKGAQLTQSTNSNIPLCSWEN